MSATKSMIMKIVACACLIVIFSAVKAQKVDYDKKLKELGVELIEPTKPIANYVKAVRTGNLIFLAGHGPTLPDGSNITGKVGRDLTVDQGYNAARQTAISLLSTLKAEIGDFNKVKRIVKVLGMVNCHSDFTDQPKVINGCSDLLVAIFGDKGKHARSAVGMNSLPSNIAVEIEIIVEVE
jgi:enamine deaminase RidA (YjgF/YER057c/UK114 family)